MTTWQIFCAALSLAFFAYACWPAVSSAASWLYQLGSSLLASRSDTKVVVAGGTVTAEQAQAAELILSRYIAKADKSDPTYKLIANGIKTLAEQVA